ncbi:BPI fold-containing family B member 4-like [Dasypus novemcinctus]|uniref:BPI fold-containing family B member 4-like n=1 Tax=Dasypus novemcinctus TaxID=9361 RepID=UPI00265EB725|nr:uncharacterized protein LOC101441372 [Dasypus novemcinctus]
MLLLWGSLLCWGLLPQARGEAEHLLSLRISKRQLETNITDLFFQHHVLERVARLPVPGATSDGVTVLDHLPFVGKRLSKKSSGLDLSLVGDLLSGRILPQLGELIGAGGLVIEEAKGPEVSLQILSDSLLQVTLRCKLYVSLQGVLKLKVIKNIRIGVRLEQTGNKTQVAFEECHTPPGYLSIEVLKQINPLLVKAALELVTGALDEALPFLLQKIVCPLATTLLNSLLEGLLNTALPPDMAGTEGFQYYVTSTEFTQEAILMNVQLITPCGPDWRAPRPDPLVPQPLPQLAPGSVADLAFRQNVYNDILACLYSSDVIGVDPQDSTAADLIQLLSPGELKPEPMASYWSGASTGLAISTPDPPTVRLDAHKATVTQLGSLVLLRSSNASSISVSWILHSEAVFSSRNQKLHIQFNPDSTVVTLGPYPADLEKLGQRLKASVSVLLKRVFVPLHNERLREQTLPLPNIRGISFDQARMDHSEDYMLLTIPEQ